MPIKYRINILEELKAHGYNTNRLRKERLLSEGAIQSLRDGKPISWNSLERICNMLNCQPGDVLIHEAASSLIHEAASSSADFDNETKQRLEKLLPKNE